MGGQDGSVGGICCVPGRRGINVVNSHLAGVLRRPIITERSTRLQGENKYTFEVELTSNRGIIKQAVEKLFDVTVLSVNTVTTPGKTKRFGPRLVTKRARKKAIVTLKPGDKITVFEGL